MKLPSQFPKPHPRKTTLMSSNKNNLGQIEEQNWLLQSERLRAFNLESWKVKRFVSYLLFL